MAGVQAVLVASEPTSGALLIRGAGFISGVGTYLRGTVRQECRLFKRCQNLPLGQGCSLFINKQCLNLPHGNCVVGVQSV